jgi:hypothetical protein
VGSTRRSGRVESLRKAEIEDLHRAVGADFDINWLQIAMDDALLVGRFERLLVTEATLLEAVDVFDLAVAQWVPQRVFVPSPIGIACPML